MLKPSRPTRRAVAQRRRQWPHRLVALALVLGGGAMMGAPVVETFANNQQGSEATVAYVESLAHTDPAPLSAAVERARAYNAALPANSLWDPWGDEEPTRSPAHDDYLTQLADFDALGRVRIPQINVDLPLYHDATKVPLSKGAGHMYGTSLPVGGPDTHSVIAAHTGMKSRTMFDRLPEVALDQTFFIDVHGTTLTYRVDQIQVVEPWELEAVERIAGGDHVTLVTCYTPPGEHKQRLLVRGTRVEDAATATTTTTAATTITPVAADYSIQEWMWPRIAITGGAAGVAALMGMSWAIGDRRGAR